MRDVEVLEPELACLSQHASFVRDSVGQHTVESADPIRGDEQQSISEIIDAPDFAASDR